MIKQLRNHILIVLICILSLNLSAETKTDKNTASQKSAKVKKLIIKYKKSLAKKPNDHKTLKKLAKLYFMDNSPNDAIELLKNKVTAVDKELSLLLAEAYRREKNYLDEIRILKLLIPNFEEDVNLIYYLGKAYVNINKSKEAVVEFRSVIDKKPQYEPAYWALYQVQRSKNNKYESRIVLEDMVKTFGERASYLKELCQIYAEDSFFKKAIDRCQKAILLAPEIPENHVYLGTTEAQSGNEKQGEVILKKAAQQFTDNILAQKAAGQFMESKKNYLKSFEYFKNCIAINSEEPDCIMGYARSSFELGDYKSSMESYTKACKLSRDNTTEFKIKASELRHAGKRDWHDRFTQAIMKCFY